MAILVPNWLNDLFFALMGERLPQADEDMAYMSHQAFKRFSDRLRELGQLLTESIGYAAKVLPAQNADNYARAARVLTDDGGRNHVTEFADQLDGISDGRVKTSIDIAESKISLMLELAILAAELLFLAVMTFFTGGATAGEAVEAKLRTRARILVILEIFAKRVHLLPTLSEALEEAFTTLAARLALILSAAPGRKPHGINMKDVVLSGITGGLTSVFDHTIQGGKNLFKGLFKDKTDLGAGLDKKFGAKDVMPDVNTTPLSVAATHGAKNLTSDGPLSGGKKLAAGTGNRGFDAVGEGAAETFAEAAVYGQGFSLSTFHGSVISSVNTGLMFEGVQKAGLGLRDVASPQNLAVTPPTVSAGLTTDPAKGTGENAVTHGPGQDAGTPTTGTGLPAPAPYTPGGLTEAGPPPVTTTSAGTPDVVPAAVPAQGPGAATVPAGGGSTPAKGPGVTQGQTAPGTPAGSQEGARPPAGADAGAQTVPGQGAGTLPGGADSGPGRTAQAPPQASAAGDDSAPRDTGDLEEGSGTGSETAPAPVPTSGAAPEGTTGPAASAGTSSGAAATTAQGPAAGANSPAAVKADGAGPAHGTSGPAGQDRPKADAAPDTERERDSADESAPPVSGTAHPATTADTVAPAGPGSTDSPVAPREARSEDLSGDAQDGAALPGITPVTTLSATALPRPGDLSGGDRAERTDDATAVPAEPGPGEASDTGLVVSTAPGHHDGKRRPGQAAESEPGRRADPVHTTPDTTGTPDGTGRQDDDLAAPVPIATTSGDGTAPAAVDSAKALPTVSEGPAHRDADADALGINSTTTADPAPETEHPDTERPETEGPDSDDSDTVVDSESDSGDTLVGSVDGAEPTAGAKKTPGSGRLPQSREEIARWLEGLKIPDRTVDDPLAPSDGTHHLFGPPGTQEIAVNMFTGVRGTDGSPTDQGSGADHLEHYIHPVDADFVSWSERGTTVWRNTTEDPDTVFRNGFHAGDPDNIMDVSTWVTNPAPGGSQFISTTRNRDLRKYTQRRYRYEIVSEAPGVDIPSTVGRLIDDDPEIEEDIPQLAEHVAAEEEIAFLGSVPARAVVSVLDRQTGMTGRWNQLSRSVEWARPGTATVPPAPAPVAPSRAVADPYGWGRPIAPDETAPRPAGTGPFAATGHADPFGARQPSGTGATSGGGFGGDWGGWKPALGGSEGIGGISARNSERFERLSRDLNLVIVTRAVNEYAVERLAEGALPKPLEIKAKSLNTYDLILLGPPAGASPEEALDHRSPKKKGLVGFYEPVLPPDLTAYGQEEQEAIRQRYESRRKEFRTYAAEMEGQKDRFPVIDGIVHGWAGDELRPLASDIDLFDLFTPTEGTGLSPRTYGHVMSEITRKVPEVLHGPAEYWKRKNEADEEIFRQITEPVHKGSEKVITYFPGRRPTFEGNFSRRNSLAPAQNPARAHDDLYKRGLGGKAGAEYVPAGRRNQLDISLGPDGTDAAGDGDPAAEHADALRLFERVWGKTTADRRLPGPVLTAATEAYTALGGSADRVGRLVARLDERTDGFGGLSPADQHVAVVAQKILRGTPQEVTAAVERARSAGVTLAEDDTPPPSAGTSAVRTGPAALNAPDREALGRAEEFLRTVTPQELAQAQRWARVQVSADHTWFIDAHHPAAAERRELLEAFVTLLSHSRFTDSPDRSRALSRELAGRYGTRRTAGLVGGVDREQDDLSPTVEEEPDAGPSGHGHPDPDPDSLELLLEELDFDLDEGRFTDGDDLEPTRPGQVTEPGEESPARDFGPDTPAYTPTGTEDSPDSPDSPDSDDSRDFAALLEPLRAYAASAADRQSPDVEVVLMAYPGVPGFVDLIRTADTGHAFVAVLLPGREDPITLGFRFFGELTTLALVDGTMPGGVTPEHAEAFTNSRADILASYRVNADQLGAAFGYAEQNFRTTYNLVTYNCVAFARGFVEAAVGHEVAPPSVVAPNSLIEHLRSGTRREWTESPKLVELTEDDRASLRRADAWLEGHGGTAELSWALNRVFIDHQRPVVSARVTEGQQRQLDLLAHFAVLGAERLHQHGEAAARELLDELGVRYGTSRTLPPDILPTTARMLEPLRSYAAHTTGPSLPDAEVVVMTGRGGQPAVGVRLPGRPGVIGLRFGADQTVPGTTRWDRIAGGLFVEHSAHVHDPDTEILRTYQVDAAQLRAGHRYALANLTTPYSDSSYNATSFVRGFLGQMLGGDPVTSHFDGQGAASHSYLGFTQAYLKSYFHTTKAFSEAMRAETDDSWSTAAAPVTELSDRDEQVLRGAARTLTPYTDAANAAALSWAKLRVLLDHQRPSPAGRAADVDASMHDLLRSFRYMVAAEYRSEGEQAARQLSWRLGLDYGTWRSTDKLPPPEAVGSEPVAAPSPARGQDPAPSPTGERAPAPSYASGGTEPRDVLVDDVAYAMTDEGEFHRFTTADGGSVHISNTRITDGVVSPDVARLVITFLNGGLLVHRVHPQREPRTGFEGEPVNILPAGEGQSPRHHDADATAFVEFSTTEEAALRRFHASAEARPGAVGLLAEAIVGPDQHVAFTDAGSVQVRDLVVATYADRAPVLTGRGPVRHVVTVMSASVDESPYKRVLREELSRTTLTAERREQLQRVLDTHGPAAPQAAGPAGPVQPDGTAPAVRTVSGEAAGLTERDGDSGTVPGRRVHFADDAADGDTPAGTPEPAAGDERPDVPDVADDTAPGRGADAERPGPAIEAQLDEHRPPRLDRSMPAPPVHGRRITFSDGSELPVHLTGDGDPETRWGAYGHSRVVLRGADQVLAEVTARAGLVRGRDDRLRDGALEHLARALRDTPQAFLGEGYRSPTFLDNHGLIRQLHVVTRPGLHWERFGDDAGSPVRFDSVHRSQVTAGSSAMQSSTVRVAPSFGIGPVPGGPSAYGRVGMAVKFTRSFDYAMQDQTLQQSETRTSDTSHLHLVDVLYEVYVVSPAQRSTDEVFPGEDHFSFGMRNGLTVRLSDSDTSPVPAERAPATLDFGTAPAPRFAHTEDFGPVDALRDWALSRLDVRPEDSAYDEASGFFTTDNFRRIAQRAAQGAVPTRQLLGGEGDRTPLGAFVVERIVPVTGVLLNESDAAELRLTVQQAVKNERMLSKGYGQQVSGSAGPSADLTEFFDDAAGLRLMAGLYGQYSRTATHGSAFGGTANRKIVGQVKGVPTELYQVHKRVHVRRTGDRESTAFDVWSLDRMPLTEARRLAGWDDGTAPLPTDAAPPVPPVYLTGDRPTVLGLSRPEAFLSDAAETYDGPAPDGDDADAVAPTTGDGPRPTLLQEFTDRLIEALAARHPSMIAALSELGDPDAPRWSGPRNYQVALQNTLTVINTLSFHSMAGNLETAATTGVEIGLVGPGFFTDAHRRVVVHAGLSGLRSDGGPDDSRTRYGTQATERADSVRNVVQGGEIGFDVSLGVRGSGPSPRNLGALTAGPRAGRSTGHRTGAGSTASYETLHIGTGRSQRFSYRLDLRAQMSGFRRPTYLFRGVASAGLLGTHFFVVHEPPVDLIGGTAGDPVTGRVVLAVADEHLAVSGPHTAPRPQDGHVSVLGPARAEALATGRDGDPPVNPFGDLPYHVLSIGAHRELLDAAAATMAEASNGSWHFGERGAPAHEAALRPLLSQYLTANHDLSSSATGLRVTGLFGQGPYLNRAGLMVHRVRLREPRVISDLLGVQVEHTLGAETQTSGAVTTVQSFAWTVTQSDRHLHDPGPGFWGTYGLFGNRTTSRVTSVAVSRRALADANMVYTPPEGSGFLLVTADTEHEVVGMVRGDGLLRPLHDLATSMRSHWAGRLVRFPSDFYAHVPERTAHRLGWLRDHLGQVPLYTERRWEPLLQDDPMGRYPVNSLDTADIHARFDRLMRSAGVDSASREAIGALLNPRMMRTLRDQASSTGKLVRAALNPSFTERWISGVGTLRMRLTAHPPTFDGLGHGASLRDGRHATETREALTGKTASWALGALVSEGVRTGDDTVRAAGPALTEQGTSVRQGSSSRTNERLVNNVFSTSEPHAEFLTSYTLRLSLDQGDGSYPLEMSGDIGHIRDQIPLSLTVPAGDGPRDTTDPLGVPRPPVPARAVGFWPAHETTQENIERWRGGGTPDGRPFEVPTTGYLVRRVTGLPTLVEAAELAVARAYGVALPVRDGQRLTGGELGPALRKARGHGLTRSGTASSLALNEGLSNTALTAFYADTAQAHGYQVPGLTDNSFIGKATGGYRVHSRPDFTRAQLLAVAPDASMESAARATAGGDSSVSRVGTQQLVLGGGTRLNTVDAGTANTRFSPADGTGAESEATRQGGADATQTTLKPTIGRAFLFTVPTAWLGVGEVRHQIKDSAAWRRARGLAGPYGHTRRGPQAVETESQVHVWISDDVARRLGLVTDANFPPQVADAWAEVTKASDAWVAADTAYWDRRRALRTGREELRAAYRDSKRALSSAKRRLERSAGLFGHRSPEALEARRVVRGRTEAVLAARAFLDEDRERLRPWLTASQDAAAEFHRVRSAADRLTRWHRLPGEDAARDGVPGTSRSAGQDGVGDTPWDGPERRRGVVEPPAVLHSRPDSALSAATGPAADRFDVALADDGATRTLTPPPVLGGAPWPGADRYTVHDTPGDGDSFFHAFAEALHRAAPAALAGHVASGDRAEMIGSLRTRFADGLIAPGDGSAGEEAGSVTFGPVTEDEAARAGIEFTAGSPRHREFTGTGRLPLHHELSADQRARLTGVLLRRPGTVPGGDPAWETSAANLLPAVASRAFGVRVTVVGADGGVKDFGSDGTRDTPPHVVLHREGNHFRFALPSGFLMPAGLAPLPAPRTPGEAPPHQDAATTEPSAPPLLSLRRASYDVAPWNTAQPGEPGFVRHDAARLTGPDGAAYRIEEPRGDGNGFWGALEAAFSDGGRAHDPVSRVSGQRLPENAVLDPDTPFPHEVLLWARVDSTAGAALAPEDGGVRPGRLTPEQRESFRTSGGRLPHDLVLRPAQRRDLIKAQLFLGGDWSAATAATAAQVAAESYGAEVVVVGEDGTHRTYRAAAPRPGRRITLYRRGAEFLLARPERQPAAPAPSTAPPPPATAPDDAFGPAVEARGTKAGEYDAPGVPVGARATDRPRIDPGARVEGTGTPREDRDFGPLAGPKRVKDTELDDQGDVRLNPLWYRLEDFRPALLERRGARWHFAVDEDGRILIGSEQPLGIADDEELGRLLDGMRDSEANAGLTMDELRKALDGQGHPTVAAGFTAHGDTRIRPARIAGELAFDPGAGRWEVSDKSGRYMSSRIRPGLRPADAHAWLTNVAERMGTAFGTEITPVLYKNSAPAAEPAGATRHGEAPETGSTGPGDGRRAPDHGSTPDGRGGLADTVRRMVAPRESRILDRSGLERIVRSASARRDGATDTGGGRERSEPVSLSPQELSEQECLVLLQDLRDELFPQGVAPAGAADDGLLGIRPQRSALAAGPGWNRIDGRPAVETALRSAGPGSTAFVLARRPHRIGHAFAAYLLAPRHQDGAADVVWIDLQRPDGAQIGDRAPDIASADVQAIVVDRTARVRADVLLGGTESERASAALVDPAASHQYGALGMEVEFEQYVDVPGDLQYEVVATHTSGSEVRIDGAPVWRAGGAMFVERADALAAGHHNPVLEMRNLLEFVSTPAGVLSGESRRIDLESALTLVGETGTRLAITGPRPAREVFRQRDGWAVTPEFADVAVLPAPRGNRRESPYVQFTVGVPVDGILPLLQLVEARFGKSRDPLERLFITSRNLGAALAQRFVEQRSGSALAPGEVNLFTGDSRVREVWGYGWLLFDHVAAAPVHNLSRAGGLVKNLLPVASRNPLGRILEDLDPQVRVFLAGELGNIRNDVVKMVRDHLSARDPKNARYYAAADVLDEVLLDRSHTVDDYITHAVRGAMQGRPSIDQRVGIGMNAAIPYEYLDSHAGTPLALLELRNYGYDKGRMTAQYVDYYFREVSTSARTSFSDTGSHLDRDLSRAVRAILSHPRVRLIAPLLEAARHIRPNGESSAYHQSVTDGSQNRFLVRSLSELALLGRRLPAGAARDLQVLAAGARRELMAQDSPTLFRPESIRQRLDGAIQAVQALTAPAPVPPPVLQAPQHAAPSRGPLPPAPRRLPQPPGGQRPGYPAHGYPAHGYPAAPGGSMYRSDSEETASPGAGADGAADAVFRPDGADGAADTVLPPDGADGYRSSPPGSGHEPQPAGAVVTGPTGDLDDPTALTEGLADEPLPIGDGSPEALAVFLRSVTEVPSGQDVAGLQQHSEQAEFAPDPLRESRELFDLWRSLGTTSQARHHHPAGKGDGAAAERFRARTQIIERSTVRARALAAAPLTEAFLASPSTHLREALKTRQDWIRELELSATVLTGADVYYHRTISGLYGRFLGKQVTGIDDELKRRDGAGSAERDPRVGWLLDEVTEIGDLDEVADRMAGVAQVLDDVIHRARRGDMDLPGVQVGELEQRRGDMTAAVGVFSALSRREIPWEDTGQDVRRELIAAELHTQQLQPHMESAALHRLRHLNRRWGTTYPLDEPGRAAALLADVHTHLTSPFMAPVTHVDSESLERLMADPGARMDDLLGVTTDPGTPGATPFRAVPARLVSTRRQSAGATPHDGIAIHWKQTLRGHALHTPVPAPAAGAAVLAAPAGFRTGFTLTSLHALLVRGDEDAVRLALAEVTGFAHDPVLLRESTMGRMTTSAHFGVIIPGELGWQDVENVVVPHWDPVTLHRAAELLPRLRDFARDARLPLFAASLETAPPLTPSVPPAPVSTPVLKGDDTMGLDYFPLTRRTATALRGLVTQGLYVTREGARPLTTNDPTGKPPWTIPGRSDGQPFFVRAARGNVPGHTLVQYDNGVVRDLSAREFAARVVADIPADAAPGPVVLLVPYGGAGHLKMPRLLAALTGRQVWAFTRDLDVLPHTDQRSKLVTAFTGRQAHRDGTWVLSEPDDLRRPAGRQSVPDAVVLMSGGAIPEDYLLTTPLPHPETFRPTGRASHVPAFQYAAQPSQGLWPALSEYREGAGTDPRGEARRLLWKESGAGEKIYYWDGHGRKDAVRVALEGGREGHLPPDEFGLYLRRRPSGDFRKFVLVTCNAGDGGTKPAVAQTVANITGSETFATNTQVNGYLNVSPRPDGQEAAWLRFSPQPAAEPAPTASVAAASDAPGPGVGQQEPSGPGVGQQEPPRPGDGAQPAADVPSQASPSRADEDQGYRGGAPRDAGPEPSEAAPPHGTTGHPRLLDAVAGPSDDGGAVDPTDGGAPGRAGAEPSPRTVRAVEILARHQVHLRVALGTDADTVTFREAQTRWVDRVAEALGPDGTHDESAAHGVAAAIAVERAELASTDPRFAEVQGLRAGMRRWVKRSDQSLPQSDPPGPTPHPRSQAIHHTWTPSRMFRLGAGGHGIGGMLWNQGVAERERALSIRYGVHIGPPAERPHDHFSHSTLSRIEGVLAGLPPQHLTGLVAISPALPQGGIHTSEYDADRQTVDVVAPYRLPSWLVSQFNRGIDWQRTAMDRAAMPDYRGIDSRGDRAMGLAGQTRQISGGVSNVLAHGNFMKWLLRHEVGHHVDQLSNWLHDMVGREHFGGWRVYSDSGYLLVVNAVLDRAGLGDRRETRGKNGESLVQAVATALHPRLETDRTESLTALRDAFSHRSADFRQALDQIARFAQLAFAHPWMLDDGGGDVLDIGGRMYHVSTDNRWVSYLRAQRTDYAVSNYQYSRPVEWFAEAYAAFYDPDPGPRARLHPATRDFFERELPELLRAQAQPGRGVSGSTT
ncbi:hypothetical protein [Streptomyces sp. NPDC056796]|uniref:scabin-related ADP-ribosyltransferase n=1 Tax=Streptomyces sp. NPDC056796 TaxID=3345947 RepID=UPI0036C2C674